MKLSGSHISLRALEPSDIDLLYKWENDTSIWKVSSTLVPFSKHILEQYILTSHQDIFTSKQLRLIIQKSDGKAVGTIDLFDFDPQHSRAGIGVLIAEDADKRMGYASEALELLTEYCFKTLDLNQIYCNVAKDNEASIKLFMKFNFEITGIKKQWIRDGKTFADEYLMQLFRK